jgi:hypothetical protein
VAQRAEPNIKAVVKYWANLSEKLWLFLLGIIRDKIPENKKPIRGRKIVSLANMKIDKKLKNFWKKRIYFRYFITEFIFGKSLYAFNLWIRKLKVTWCFFGFFVDKRFIFFFKKDL